MTIVVDSDGLDVVNMESEDDLARSIREDGFLSESLESALPRFREINREWVDFSKDLNRLALRFWIAHDNVVLGRTGMDPVSIACRIMLRALSNFQAAIILAERGLVAEADCLSRGLYEAGFWLGYLSEEPTEAAGAFIADEKNSQKSLLKHLRRIEEATPGVFGLDLAEIDRRISAVGPSKSQDLEELAKKAGHSLFYSTYKRLSSGSAHASLASTYAFMSKNADGTFSGHIFGPDVEGAMSSFSSACHGLILCIAGYSGVLGKTEQDADLIAAFKRYEALSIERDAGPE
ncbi:MULTISPECIES: DUF5677 domain-containing protein [unclassified Mesorhizobium]|uniref:DUF5677 domain-containing protein n=1 Tax=unclassified Mesorhizobium TaxID=325217 RepID=UPI000BB067C2|nr:MULTISPECIES: DUF5677 domain-containing protein [unclassified Mesorhizobium]PBB26129.1 hypothetical protein CK232_13360 [Mesorhizobium sp. WSM4304]PBB75784.1 hypothetical protein CK227_09295 [Mesorhizobium sp. WSM4308]